MSWITRDGFLEKEGVFCYEGDGCQSKSESEFKKTIQFFDSVPIIVGTEHPKNFTLDEVVGKVNNFSVNNGKWRGKWNFDEQRLNKYPELKRAITLNQDIPASVSDWVKSDGKTHKDQVPVHVLIHPQLIPNIEGAGIKNNTKIKFGGKHLEDLEKLKAENSKITDQLNTLATENKELKKSQENLESKLRGIYTKQILGKSEFSEEDLKKKTLPEIEAISDVLGKVKIAANTLPEPPKGKPPVAGTTIPLGNQTVGTDPEREALENRYKKLLSLGGKS